MHLATIISLSSIPPRFDKLGPTLRSLLAQDGPVTEIQLWIPRTYRRFPDWDGRLPDVPQGITIMRCEADLGPATKVLPAVRHFRDKDVNILFCDDDRLYDSGLVSSMLAVMAERPGCCIAAYGRDIPGDLGRPARSSSRLPRANRLPGPELARGLSEFLRLAAARPLGERTSGFVDLLVGYCGAMVKPAHFGPETFTIPPVLWAVDDIWLSGQLECQGIPIWVDDRIPMPMEREDVMGVAALLDATIEAHDRHAANRACVAYFRETYGIWRPSQTERFLARLRPPARRLALALRPRDAGGQ